jgi:murein DD-endopeptidase MepM/ murein hydrolase activator NlpD
MGLGLRRATTRAAAAALALLLPLVLVTGTRADDLQDKKKERDQVSGLIGSLQAQIAATQNQEVNLQALIASLNAQIAAQQKKIEAAQAVLDGITADLVKEKAVLKTTQAKLATDKAGLTRATKLIYEASDQNTPLNNLVGAHSFNDFWTNLLDTRAVADQLQGLVGKVQGEKQQVDAQVAHITDEQNHQKAVVDEMHQQRAVLDAEQAAQREAARQLAVVVAQDQARLAQAEAAQKQLDSEIAAIIAAQAAAAANGGGGSGQFAWPLHGPISQGYGCTPYYFEPYDPNCASKHFHTGLDIASGCGADISAADSGVAYAFYSNWGYGDHVIIAHGNGWTTVYGHMSSIAVGNGQGVGRGQYIGAEGSTGNSTGCHLHFEIDHNGGSVNPWNYLP